MTPFDPGSVENALLVVGTFAAGPSAVVGLQGFNVFFGERWHFYRQKRATIKRLAQLRETNAALERLGCAVLLSKKL